MILWWQDKQIKHIIEVAQGKCVCKVGAASDEGKTIKYKYTVAIPKRIPTVEGMLLSDLQVTYTTKGTQSSAQTRKCMIG